MIYMTMATEWLLDMWAVVLAALVFLYNYAFQKENSQLWITSLIVVFLYAIGHFLLNWINELPLEVDSYFRYSSRLILYAIANAAVVIVVYQSGPSHITRFAIINFSICMVFQFILHIDRNVIALNKLDVWVEKGTILTNKYPSEGYWWLWDAYSAGLQFLGLSLFAYLIFGDYLKGFVCSLRS